MASVLIMQRAIELDCDKQVLSRFRDTLVTISEEERLNTDAPQVPFITPLEEVKLDKNMSSTVKESLRIIYNRHDVEEIWLQDFEKFVDQNLLRATCDLQGTMSYKTLDIENAGQLLFNFCELEESPDISGYI